MNLYNNHLRRVGAIVAVALAFPAATAVAADTVPQAPEPVEKSDNASSAVAATNNSATEHLRLDTTIVKGHEGLPRVLYIVPWKRSDTGDLQGRPAASLLDEVLAPVDRAEFRDQMRYYDALSASAAAANAAQHPTP